MRKFLFFVLILFGLAWTLALPAAQLPITFGAAPNDGTGQTLRSAMGNAQTNFTELYSNMNVLNSTVGGLDVNQFATVNGTNVFLKTGVRTTNENAFGAWTNNGTMAQHGAAAFDSSITAAAVTVGPSISLSGGGTISATALSIDGALLDINGLD